MAKQESTVPDDNELVWVESPATGRKKQVSRGKARILALSRWKTVDEPKEDDPLVVAPFPSVAPGDIAPADQPEQNTRAARGAATQKEGS